MKVDLRINGSATVWDDWGLRMGEGFLDALTEPLSIKPYVENESRLEHGKRIVVDSNPKIESRDLELDFTITGVDEDDFRKKRDDFFFSVIYRGNVDIQVPALGSETYHLVYLGKGGEYGLSPLRNFCHFILKFTEPNPMNR